MSDLGDAGGEVLGMFIGVPVAVICVLALPFIAIQKGCEYIEGKKHKVEQTRKVYDVIQNPKDAVKHPILTYKSLKGEKEPIVNVPKESLSFRAGQKVKESSKDFVRGIFTKKQQ